MATVTEKMHPFAAAQAVGREPFKVKDLALIKLRPDLVRYAPEVAVRFGLGADAQVELDVAVDVPTGVFPEPAIR